MDGLALKLFGKLTMDSSEFDKKLDDAREESKGFASSFVNVMGGALKAGIAAIGSASVAVGAFAKEAIDSYAEYEQLIGGVQKLYGNAGMSLEEYAQANGKSVDEVRDKWQSLEDAQNQVLKNAENAFLTSGMSTNEYMETATSFSAALINSLGGDTQKAAEITDVAMRAMSDNVNTFGSDAEAVQNAFMGLSRQNYMMIDNLKLGYAGTAQGMMELINDSGVLGKTLTNTSELADVGFDQMIMAIQAVQEQQGIAGTTAREALHTIEGSATATSKAWENVKTAIGRGEGLDDALNGMMTALLGDESGGGLINNLIPRIQTVMEGIADFVVEAGPIIAEKLPELVDSIFPALFETATSLLASLGTSLPSIVASLFPILMDTAVNVINTLYGYLMENMHIVLESGAEALRSLAEGIRSNLPTLIATALEMIVQFAGEILANLPEIISAGIEVILALVEGITQATPNVLSAIGQILSDAWGAITSFDWAGTGKAIIDGIVSGIRNFGGAIGNTLKEMASSAWKSIKGFFGISSPSKLMRDTIGRYIPEGLAEGIYDTADSVYDAMDELAEGTADSYDPFFDSVFETGSISKDDSASNSLLGEISDLKNAIMGMQIVLDTGAMVGGLSDGMDKQLGINSRNYTRGI